MPSQPIRLGPFELHAPVGRGGMAEVWRGIHLGRQVPVAVKVITAMRAREPRFRAAFRNEVQSAARLNHPSIILLFDYGEVPVQTERASRGRVAAGSPYLAMELASLGTLDRVRLPLRWSDLSRILLSLLDALAHAHARGVIHRDLKPANILLASDDDPRPGLKLSDFGIAHALDARRGKEQGVSGTPHFMAPEQFTGRWRDYGPWTDLYAVGCLAHYLATGALPFQGESAVQLAWAHLNAPPPDLDPALGLPLGFARWIQRLLVKPPRDRFRRAADAGWALLSMKSAAPEAPPPKAAAPKAPKQERATVVDDPGPPGGGPFTALLAEARKSEAAQAPTVAGETGELTTVAAETSNGSSPAPETRVASAELATLVQATEHTRTFPWIGDTDEQTDPKARAPIRARPIDELEATNLYPRRIPPLPRSWRRKRDKSPSIELVGAGLGLWGLRTVPLVDRNRERDGIWSALREVRREGRARAVVLRGSAGHGKSRLVEWMTERAAEVGSAIVLKAVHGPTPGPWDGIGRMVARHLRCMELPHQGVLERAEHLMREQGVEDEYEWHALAELMSPAHAERRRGGTVVRFGRATERHVLVRRLAERATRERPVIIWIEDAQWASDALAFALHIIDAQEDAPHPILLALTVQDEALAHRPVERQALEELLAQPRTHEIRVPPLRPKDQRKLVGELLLLETSLADQVVARSGGNPLFAVQLVGDWVDRGVLQVGDDGFELQAGERASVPDDIHDLWTRRIAQVLADQPEPASQALELAAVLGMDVDAGEWAAACHEASLQVPVGLVDLLIDARLAHRNEGGWRFAHGMLRESLERTAREAGRLQDHHWACAAMLERTYGETAPAIGERVGRHHLQSGSLARAIEPMLEGARERFTRGEVREATGLLEERQRALTALGADEDDARFGQGWLLEAQIATLQGQFEYADERAQQAERQADRWGYKHILAEAIEARANVAYERGDWSTAIPAYERAQHLFEWMEDRRGVARCLLGLGESVYRLGDHPQAERFYDAALPLFEEEEDALGQANVLLAQGYVALWRGELAEALDLFSRPLPLLRALGNRLKLARALSSLGEVARQSGDLAAAEARYREALAIDEAIGANSVWIDRLNMGLVLLARGQFREARTLVETQLQAAPQAEDPSQLCFAHAELLPSLAEARDWGAWDRHLAETKALLARTGLRDGDVAWLMELAAVRAEPADRARAKEALSLALAQWQALERPDKSKRLEETLKRLSRPS